MDRHHVEVGHRCTHNNVKIRVPPLEPLNHFVHESRDLGGIRRLVDEPAVASRYANRSGAPSARDSLPLKGAGVEMEVENDPVEPAERRVCSHGSDVIHRPRVTGNRRAVLVIRVDGLLAVHECDGLSGSHAESLDRSRAFDAAGPDLAPQCANPGHASPDL